MQYRKLGKTGINISTLGFGCMRFPEIKTDSGSYIEQDKVDEMIRTAYENGVNYFDTAFYYCNQQSEVALGKAVKGFRDKIYISTKLPMGDVHETADYRRILEKSLKKLDTSYIDVYHFWSTNRSTFDDKIVPLGLVKEAVKAKEEGLIRHIAFSFHGNPDDLDYITDIAPELESLLIQYNLIDRSNEKGIEKVAAKGLGVIAMGPVGGGRLSAPTNLSEKIEGVAAKATYELALRFVLGNKNIACALSGMTKNEEVLKNVAVMSSEIPFSDEENKNISDSLENLKKFSDLYCTGCGYCMPCPNGIDIPKLFYMYTLYNVYGLKDLASKSYAEYNNEQKGLVSDCINCRSCERKCPQKLNITENLKKVDKTLSGR